MGLTSFFTSYFTSKPSDPLPVHTRLDTMESDMLHLRSAVDSLQGSLRKVSGKVYRGVALGDTVSPEAPPGSQEEPGPPEQQHHQQQLAKQDLYQRAAQLRRH